LLSSNILTLFFRCSSGNIGSVPHFFIALPFLIFILPDVNLIDRLALARTQKEVSEKSLLGIPVTQDFFDAYGGRGAGEKAAFPLPTMAASLRNTLVKHIHTINHPLKINSVSNSLISKALINLINFFLTVLFTRFFTASLLQT
jgi:hypothetical protein